MCSDLPRPVSPEAAPPRKESVTEFSERMERNRVEWLDNPEAAPPRATTAPGVRSLKALIEDVVSAECACAEAYALGTSVKRPAQRAEAARAELDARLSTFNCPRAPLAGSPSLESGAPTAAETTTCPPCPECKSALTVEFGVVYGCMECGHNWDRPRIPDDGCATREDGECISSQPCMHSAPLARVALLYAVEDAAYEYGYGMGAGRGSKRAKLDAARAALDRHIASLERDAARMRAALNAVGMTPLDDGAPAPEMGDGAAADYFREQAYHMALAAFAALSQETKP